MPVSLRSRSARRRSLRTVLLIAVLCLAALVKARGADAPPPAFLGLTAPPPPAAQFWEGPTDYGFALRPHGAVRAIMLFARFPDTTAEEDTRDLYTRLAPQSIDYFARVSYGKMTLQIDALHRWIPMDHPSTYPDYKTSEFHTQRTHLREVIEKAASQIDFRRYDIVYVVDSRAPGMPNSPTFGASPGDGIRIQGTEIRHGVTFGNDTRDDRWGWQTLCHETGHIFGLPDLYSFDYAPPYKHIQRYVGFWDIMGFQATGSEYLAWQKRKLEWLTDDQFAIVPAPTGADSPKAMVVALSPIYIKGGVKAVVVPLSATEAYVAEVRSRDGWTGTDTSLGVLLYRVSLTAEHEGFLRVLAAAPDTDPADLATERRFITLYNALFHEGIVLNDTTARARIEIVGRDGQNFRLRVTR